MLDRHLGMLAPSPGFFVSRSEYMNNPVTVEFLDKFAAALKRPSERKHAIISMMAPDAVMLMSARA